MSSFPSCSLPFMKILEGKKGSKLLETSFVIRGSHRLVLVFFTQTPTYMNRKKLALNTSTKSKRFIIYIILVVRISTDCTPLVEGNIASKLTICTNKGCVISLIAAIKWFTQSLGTEGWTETFWIPSLEVFNGPSCSLRTQVIVLSPELSCDRDP